MIKANINMPKSCYSCWFCQDDNGSSYPYCGPTGIDVDDCDHRRHEKCILTEVKDNG